MCLLGMFKKSALLSPINLIHTHFLSQHLRTRTYFCIRAKIILALLFSFPFFIAITQTSLTKRYQQIILRKKFVTRKCLQNLKYGSTDLVVLVSQCKSSFLWAFAVKSIHKKLWYYNDALISIRK